MAIQLLTTSLQYLLHRVMAERAFQNDCRHFLTRNNIDSHWRAPSHGFFLRGCSEVPEQSIWYFVLFSRLGHTVHILADDTHSLNLMVGLDATNLPLCSRSTLITPVTFPESSPSFDLAANGRRCGGAVHHLESKDAEWIKGLG